MYGKVEKSQHGQRMEIIFEQNMDNIEVNTDESNISDVERNNHESNTTNQNKRQKLHHDKYSSAEQEMETNFISPEISSDYTIVFPTSILQNGASMQNQHQHNDCSNASTKPALASVLREINLYEELYDLFKSKDVTYESLKYMKVRHIDELFNGCKLSSKIIFEHRLLEWQQKHQAHLDGNVSSIEITQKPCERIDQCQVLSIKPLTGTTSTYHIVGVNDVMELPTRLMEVLQVALDRVLTGLKILPEYHDVDERKTDDINESDLTDKMMKSPNSYIESDIQQLSSKIEEYNDYDHIEMDNADEDDFVDETTEDQNGCNDSKLQKFAMSNKASKIEEYNVMERTKSMKPSNQIINNQRLEPSTMYIRSKTWGLTNEVKEILLMYKSGNVLLENYQDLGMLTPELRTELVYIIADHFVTNNEFLTLLQCRTLAEEIVKIFPNENVDTYFLQETRSSTPKGKLWDRYQNRKRHKRSMNSCQTSQYNVYTRNDRSEMESMCQELKYVDDENRLFKKWKKTFQYRRYQIESESFSTLKLYFDQYPFCKQSNYAQFINSDLQALYPNLKFNTQLWEEFVLNFKTVYWNRISHLQSKELFNELISAAGTASKSEYLEVKITELLHAVLNDTADSIEEAQRQFIVEVTDLSELKRIVIERKKFCLDNGLQCKPYIAVVGQNCCYEHYSVVIDSTGFSCDSYQEALVLCFKLYLFFDLSYTEETLNTWLFIQKYFFNKHSMMENPVVDAFILDVRKQRGQFIL